MLSLARLIYTRRESPTYLEYDKNDNDNAEIMQPEQPEKKRKKKHNNFSNAYDIVVSIVLSIFGNCIRNVIRVFVQYVFSNSVIITFYVRHPVEFF